MTLKRLGRFLLWIVAAAPAASFGYQAGGSVSRPAAPLINIERHPQQRRWHHGAAGAATITLMIGSTIFAPLPATASQYCSSGVGEACEELAGGNAYIRQLQEQSAQNREQHIKQARDAYYMKNYPDFFASTGQNLVRQADGTFTTISSAQLDQLAKSGRLRLEYPKIKNGMADVTQKPIIVLKE